MHTLSRSHVCGLRGLPRDPPSCVFPAHPQLTHVWPACTMLCCVVEAQIATHVAAGVLKVHVHAGSARNTDPVFLAEQVRCNGLWASLMHMLPHTHMHAGIRRSSPCLVPAPPPLLLTLPLPLCCGGCSQDVVLVSYSTLLQEATPDAGAALPSRGLLSLPWRRVVLDEVTC